jgi:putative colanic acid biosynthesis acetyltransferase WcaF
MGMKLEGFTRKKTLKFRIIQGLWLVVSWAFFTTYFPWPSLLKKGLLILFGAEIGSNLVIRPNVFIKLPWKLHLGDNTWIGYGVFIDNEDDVYVEESVCISQKVSIFTGSHNFRDENFAYVGKCVRIQAGSWVAANSLILPGSDISRGSFIKAGSVVK